MKRKSRTSRFLTCLVLALTLVFAQIPSNYAAESNADSEKYDYNSYSNSTGLKEPTAEGLKWIKENMIKTENVKLNELGLERINKERKLKKLEKLSSDLTVKEGSEVAGAASNSISAEGSTGISASSSYIPAAATLGSSVDNSELAAFPPIRSQGGIGSCVCFATTYYQMTYTVAKSYGWNTKDNTNNSNKFSPKWTYNFINGGSDGGSSYDSAYRVLSLNGAALWSDFPYNGDNTNPVNYLEWPTQSSVYKNAMKYKVDKMGYISINSSTDTPVTSPQDSDLNDIKTLLTDGYVLVIPTCIYSWNETVVKDDPATTGDNQFVGQNACYMMDGYNGSHGMTVVGYNDNIWVDINNNNQVDSGEKGAFKIANSWGTDYGNNGYMWVCYDALNTVSAVSGAPAVEFRAPIFTTAYWITVKQSYNPKFIAEFTLNHAYRNEISTYLGYSNSIDTNPALIWRPCALGDNTGGNYAFNGTTTPCDGTFALDFTDLYSANYSNTDGNWYLSVSDSFANGNPVTLKNFKIIDNVRGIELNSTSQYPQSCDGLAIVNKILSTRTVPTPADWTVQSSLPQARASLACAGINGNLYVFGNNDQTNSVMAYNPQTGVWSSKSNAYPSYYFTGAVAFNDKIYVLGSSDYTNSTLFEYNPASDSWVVKSTVPYRSYTTLVTVNNKIYIIGGSPEYDMVREYDPTTGIMSTKANIPARLADAGISSVNNKIYVFGGTDQNNYTPQNTVYVFDPVSGTWSNGSNMPIVKANFKSEVINGKIYTFGGTTENYNYSGSVEEYDPVNNTWTQAKSSMIYKIYDYYLTTLDNQIYLLGGRTDGDLSTLVASFSMGNVTGPTPTPTQTATYTPTPTQTVSSTPTPTPTAASNINVEFFNGNTSSQTATISTNFKVTNTGSAPVDLSLLKIRYYYTIDGEINQNFWCDYSNISSTKITGNFIKLATPVSNADYYLEIGFTSDSGILSPGNYVQINSRIAKSDWSQYTQTNDFSFNASSSSWVPWDKTPAYISGIKVWGINP